MLLKVKAGSARNSQGKFQLERIVEFMNRGGRLVIKREQNFTEASLRGNKMSGSCQI